MGQSPPGSSYNHEGHGLPFIQGSAEFGEHTPNPVKWCQEPRKVARIGDLLVSVRAPVGDTNFAGGDLAIGRGVAIVRGLQGIAGTSFLRLALQYESHALLRRSGGGMFTSVTGAGLRGLPIPLPPLPEQRRIVDLIGAVDQAIEAVEGTVGRAREAYAGVGASLLRSEADLAEIASVVTVAKAGGTPSRTNATFYSGTIPWLKSGEVNNYGIRDTEEHISEAALALSSTWVAPERTVDPTRGRTQRAHRHPRCGPGNEPRTHERAQPWRTQPRRQRSAEFGPTMSAPASPV